MNSLAEENLTIANIVILMGAFFFAIAIGAYSFWVSVFCIVITTIAAAFNLKGDNSHEFR